MEDNQQPQISVTQALNQIQSWLNAGEFDKVIQGCGEILELEPGNQRALSLMKQAEEKRHATPEPKPTPEPEFSKLTDEPEPEPEPTPEPEPEPEPEPKPEFTPPPVTPEKPFSPDRVEPEEDPLEKLQAESKPEMFEKPSHSGEKRKLFLAMLIPAVLVVIVGGSVIWYLANEDREDIIDEIVETEERDTTYLEDNEERVEDLTLMAKALEVYEAEEGEFPEPKDIESVLLDSAYFDEIPVDARQDDFDKAGKVMGYTYAVYDTIAGENTAYIISALFEDSRGFGYAWTRGASTKNYEDYRDTDEDHVTFVGGDEQTSGEPEDTGNNDDDDNNDEQFLSLGLGYNFLDRPNDTQINLGLYQTQNSTNTMNSSLISFSYRKKY